MKHMRSISLLILTAAFTACTQHNCDDPATTDADGDKPTAYSHGATTAGDFDFDMSSVCQEACGVSDYEEADITPIAEARVGDITMCPVSGAVYEVKENSPVLEHNGITYHACCGGCAEKFKEDPERFHQNTELTKRDA